MTLSSDAATMREIVQQLAQLVYELSVRTQSFIDAVPAAEQRAAKLDELLAHVNQLERKKAGLEAEIGALELRKNEILTDLEKLRLKLG